MFNGYRFFLSITLIPLLALSIIVPLRSQSEMVSASWVQVESLPQGLAWSEIVRYRDRLYTIGGSRSSSGVDAVYTTRVSTDGVLEPWISARSLPNKLYIHAAVVSNGQIFVIGGWDGSNWHREVLRSTIQPDGSLGAWGKVGDYPTEIALHDAVAVGPSVYVVGGQNIDGGLTSVRYALVDAAGNLGSWADTSGLPIPLYRLSVTASDRFLYVTGGYDGASARSDVFYAPINPNGSLGAWIPTTAMPDTRYYHGSHIRNGRLTVVGGQGANGELANVCSAPILANGTLGGWTCDEPTLPEPLQRFGSVIYPLHGSDALYVFGGRNGDNYRNNVYLLTEPGMDVTLRNFPNTFVAPSQTVTYTVAYKNRPFFALDNVNVVATVPAGTQIVTGSQGVGQIVGDQVKWSVGALAKSQSDTVSYQVRRPHPADGIVPMDDSDNQLHITTFGPLLATTGQPFTYVLTATSDITVNKQLILTETLPSGTNYVTYSDGGVVSGSVISWTVPGIQPGEAIVRSVTVTTTQAGTLTNAPAVVSGIHEVTSTKIYLGTGYPPIATAMLPVQTNPPVIGDLNLHKSGPYVARAGERITYTLSLTSGLDLSGGVHFTDTLPAGATFVTGTDVLTYTGSAVVWEVPSLLAGQTITRQLVVTAAQTITNAGYMATGTAINTDPITYSVTGRQAVVTYVAPPPLPNAGGGQVAIQKTGPSLVKAGDPITYSLSVTTSVPLSGGLVITDVLPANAFYLSSTGSYDPSGVVTWTVPSLLPGNTWTGTVAVTATQSITNQNYMVSASDDLTPTTHYSATGTLSVLTIVLPSEEFDTPDPAPPTQLYVTKSGPPTAEANTAVTYTLAVSSGIAIDRGLVLTEVLPSGITYLRSSDGGVHQNGVLTWTVGNLAAETVISRTFTVSVIQSVVNLRQQYGATASRTVTTTHDYSTTGQLPVVTVVIPKSIDTSPPAETTLFVAKVGPDHATFGEIFTYTLFVSSTIALDQGLVLTDTLPGGISVVSADGDAQINGQVVTWRLPALAPNNVVSRTLSVTASTHVINADYSVAGRETITDTYTYTGTASMPVITVVLLPGGDGTLVKHDAVNVTWTANGNTGSSHSAPVFNPSYDIFVPLLMKMP